MAAAGHPKAADIGRIRGPQVALAMFLGGCLLLAGCREAAAPPAAEPAPVAVRLVAVGTGAAAARREASGTVRLRRETALGFLSAGRIQSIAVRPGDRVAAGQMLASLDMVTINANAAAAAADQARAAADLRRQQILERQGWVAKARVENAGAAAQAADASLAAARFAQRHARLVVPTAGIILARLAEPGQAVDTGVPVLLLGEFASGHVLRVPLAASDMASLARGTEATIDFPDGAAPPLAGRLIEVAGRADPATGSFQVEFALPEHAALRSGLIARVRWEGGAPATPIVPATALFAARADEGFVWLHDAATGRVHARKVALGRTDGRGVEVEAGLTPGARIVAAGVDRLVEGQRVLAAAR